jgi:glycolate dehydrogenase FAD-binding subunit
MTLQPTSVEDLQAAVTQHPRVHVRGAGTKTALSAPRPGTPTLDVAGLTGVLEHTPEECTFTALAGTRIDEIETRLAACGQYLPFDPPLSASGATLGGTVAAGVNGSCRLRYGGVRDFLIGARVVDGRGRIIRSGGKVVKNAAGFLLHQALVGSCGRLGILAELTFKVFPAAEAHATLRVPVADLPAAVALVDSVRRAGFDLEALDIEPPSVIWVRLAGFRDSLASRLDAVQLVMGEGTDVSTGEHDAAIWRDARELAWVPANHALVRVPITLPTLTRLDAALEWYETVRRYTVAGNLALIAWNGALDSLSTLLRDLTLKGQVLIGPTDHRFIGAVPSNAVEERLASVMDPDARFVA